MMFDMTMFHQAKQYLDLGYSVIPLRENEKKPAIEWKEYQQRKPTLGELANWFGHGTRHNIGIVCGSVSSNLYVRDFDSRELAVQYFQHFRDRIKTIVKTPNGVHFYHRAEGRNFQGDKQDGRGEGGYVVGVPSTVDGKAYEFAEGFGLVRPDELCEMSPPIKQKEKNGEISKLEKWLMQIESIQGQGGNKGLVRFVAKCRDGGLSQARCMELLFQWNESDRVDPPWSSKELVRAVENLYGRT